MQISRIRSTKIHEKWIHIPGCFFYPLTKQSMLNVDEMFFRLSRHILASYVRPFYVVFPLDQLLGKVLLKASSWTNFKLSLCLQGDISKVTHRVSMKYVFLKISQNSQENTCARVLFLTKFRQQYISRQLLLETFSALLSRSSQRTTIFKSTPKPLNP